MRFIYIVDDDRVSRHVMQTVVDRSDNILVRTFASGIEFLEEAPDLDAGVLLLDLNMPEVDGTQVLERLAGHEASKFATIVVSAGASVASAVTAMKLGAVDVLEKPCDPAALEQALTLAFDRLASGIASSSIAQEAKRKIDSLSPRERDVMAHLFDGHPNKETARDLGISPRTVEIHRASAMRKLGVTHLANAVRTAIVAGWEPRRNGRSGWAEAVGPVLRTR